MNNHGFREITFSINGKQRTLFIDIRKSLLEVLRQDLGLNGVKHGCGVGECGACSVLVDDVLVDFDDARSEAALSAMASLAEKTQIILFTHHSRVVEQANNLSQKAKVTIHEL